MVEEKWAVTASPAQVAGLAQQLSDPKHPFHLLKGADYGIIDDAATLTGGRFGAPLKGWWQCAVEGGNTWLTMWAEDQFWPLLTECRDMLLSALREHGWWDDLNAPDKGPAQAEHAEDAPKPWEIIPDVGWHRKAVELWHAGYTAREIARMIDRGLAPKTILNVVSNLRGIYGTEVVPERRAKSRPGRKLG